MMLCTGIASAETHLIIGTYNIRDRTPLDQTEDPATNKFWDVRADAVAQTIKDAGFDIVGINEMSNDVSFDGHSMFQDMQRNFPEPEYAFAYALSVPYDKNSTMSAILYKTSVLEVLDEGHFWHSPIMTRYLSNQWEEGTHGRMAKWCKFRVKATGEIFYYMTTHLHHKGHMAKNEGARLNVDMMRKISGNYPAFISGDQNCDENRKPVYDLYCAFFDDCYAAAETKQDNNFTNNAWDATTGEPRWCLDFVFARGAKILDYSTPKEKYGLNFYPSDHLPVRVEVVLEQPLDTRRRYVSPEAADGGDGSIEAPYNSLQAAIDASGRGDTLFISKGTYAPAPTFKIKRSLTLIGGYNDDFSAIEGVSALTGDESAQVLNIGKNAAVEMSNFDISGGKTTTEPGAGIACHGPRLMLENVSVHDNITNGTGAGVYAYGQLVAERCSFERNVTTGNGGAVFCDDVLNTMPWAQTIRNSRFSDNKAMHGSAAFIKSTMWLDAIGNTFADNEASGNGTFYLTGAWTNTYATFFNNTFANNSADKGAAIFTTGLKDHQNDGLDVASVALANNTIVANTATGQGDGFNGAAVNIGNAVNVYLNNNIIAANNSAAPQADVYCDVPSGVTASKYNVFSTATSANHAIQGADYKAASYAQAAEWLAQAFDGIVSDGKLIVQPADNGGPTPTIRIVNPVYGTYKLNNLASSRFVETTIKADINGDRQIYKISPTSAVDQRGIERDMKGHASFGACEYSPADGVTLPTVNPEADGVDEYFNLQGVRISEPSLPGIYIHRRGSYSSKIIIR